MHALFLGSGGRVGRLIKAAWSDKDILPVWHARTDGDTSFDIMSNDLDAAIADCDVVINLAGATHHGTNDIGSENTRLAKRVLDNANGRPVFLLSSAAIYGTNSGPLTELSNPAPVSDYGRDKAAMEEMAQQHPTKSIILRLGNVAGADALLGVDRTHYVLDRFTDGTYPERSYIGPRLLAKTLADLIRKSDDLPAILNLATSSAVSMADLLNAAGKTWDDRSAGDAAIAKVELDTTRLQTLVDLPKAVDAKAIVADWASIRDAS